MTTVTNNRGPKHVPLLGWRYRGLQMLKDPMKFFVDLNKTYGELCFWDPKFPKHLCLFGSQMNKYVFSKPEIFIVDAFRESKLPRNSSIERLSFGLMRLNGEEHKRHRRLMQPAFRTAVIDKYWHAIVEETRKELSDWQYYETRDINKDLIRLVTHISLKTMFGAKSTDNYSELQDLMEKLLALATSPFNLLLPYALPGLPYHKMLKTADDIEAIVKQIIHEKTKSRGDDVLSELINSHNEDDGGLTEDELISEAYTVLCHESAAAALSWLIFLLDRHPDVYEKLMQEISSLEKVPSVEEIKSLKFLDNVFKESVRLLPPSGFNLRYLNEDHEMNGIFMEKGSMVFLSSYVTHRIEPIFVEPLKFIPERWDSIQPTPYEYLPFGCGAHSCIGKYFAQLEIKLILIMILQEFRLSCVASSVIDRGMRVSMVPKHGLQMTLHKLKDKVYKSPLSGNIFESVEMDYE